MPVHKCSKNLLLIQEAQLCKIQFSYYAKMFAITNSICTSARKDYFVRTHVNTDTDCSHYNNIFTMNLPYPHALPGKLCITVTVSPITRVPIACSTVHSGTDQRKYQSSAWMTFVKAIHWQQVISSHKGPITRKMFKFDDIIMWRLIANILL